MLNSVIIVNNLSKEYMLGGADFKQMTLRESLGGIIPNSIKRLKRLKGKADEESYFWALKDINFAIAQGDVVGIIGRNGAGKSTLLKIVGRITAPTRGRIEYRGRIASLLEVGTGFHPELTGRENIYLNGAILGMSQQNIRSKMDEIVSFAEIDKFLDTPVKRYSSGMHVRLAFSVAAHLDSDILLVDEVLAVGDAAFQAKCLTRLSDVRSEGRTVLFVSHNMGSIATLCEKGIVLDRGKIVFQGGIEDAISLYMKTTTSKNGELQQGHFHGTLIKQLRFKRISINGQELGKNILIKPEETIRIIMQGELDININAFSVFASIFKDGIRIISMFDAPEGTDMGAGTFESAVELPGRFLRPGTYSIGVGGEKKGMYQWLWGPDLGEFTVLEKWDVRYEERNYGIVNYSHYGVRIQTNEQNID